MKSRCIFFFLLFPFSLSFAQTVKIPDARFKEALIALGHDTNGDGEIQRSEALKITKLYVEKAGISSLEGIKNFTNLEEFGFYDNSVRTLDVEGMLKLRAIYGWNNELSIIKLKGCSNLETLYMYANKIRMIDFSTLKKMKEIKLDQNLFDKIDLSNLPKLEEVELNKNKITEFKAAGSTEIRKLKIEENYLFELDLKPFKKLEEVYLTDNPLKKLDVRGLRSLKTLYAEGSKYPSMLTQLNTSGLVSLEVCRW